MRIEMLLEMAAARGDQLAYSDGHRRLSYAALQQHATRGAAYARAHRHRAIVTLAEASTRTPEYLFAAAMAGIPYIPLNYRLAPQALAQLLAKYPDALLINENDSVAGGLKPADWTELVAAGPLELAPIEDDERGIAALIHTSGTSAEPKAAILRHVNLVQYVLENTEFGSAEANEATLVCLPTYHVAGLMSLLTHLYTGRRVVLMARFDAAAWCAAITTEGITHVTVVPTMLARIFAWIATQPSCPPFETLRTLASGGAMLPVALLRRVLQTWPQVGLVNAYGLTETSSTVAVMDPASYRAALHSDDLDVRARLASVGRPVPGVTVQIRRPDGSRADVGEEGEIFVHGEQVSGEYVGAARPADAWFATRDLGHVDGDAYLFVHGRADDTIIRAGENIAPATIEEVLCAAPGVSEAVVVGLPDAEWGQTLAAVVVSGAADFDVDALRRWCAARLRASMTPQRIEVWPELPSNDAGKVLRREVLRRLASDVSVQHTN